jgi:hypothetical protein
MDDYSITLPVSDSYMTISGIFTVSKDSENDFREKLEGFALYFKREFKYDFIQYEANEHFYEENKYSGFLFSEMAWDQLEEAEPAQYRLFGGGCFRWRELQDHDPAWVLDWVWIHPFFRHRGYLSKHWKFLKQEYGDFLVERPLSADMEKFLAKHT